MKKQLLLVFFLLACATLSLAQHPKAEKAFQKALSAYRAHDNLSAIKQLSQAAKYDPEYSNIYLLLSEVYQDMDSTQLQINALNKCIELGESSAKLHLLLAEAQYKIGKYNDALTSLKKLTNFKPNESLQAKSERLQKKCNTAISLMNNPVNFIPIRLSDAINSENNEYWPCISINDSTITFTRLMTDSRIPQEDFYQSTLQKDSSWTSATPLWQLNTSFNEGAQSITADGKLFFFSACGRADSFGSCDIYYSRLINNQWTIPTNAGSRINTNAWESQPSVAADGSYIYFASRRSGGKGNEDIWRCTINGFDEQGRLLCGIAENLGDSINTPGNEFSPFIHPDNKTLYFSSDSWEGLGHNDIFISRKNTNNSWSQAQNIGYPINSYRNEQGLVVSASGKTAYYASDRKGAKGIDIYSFELPNDIRPTPVTGLFGQVSELAVGKSIVLNNIFFDTNSAELLPESFPELNKLIELFAQHPSLQIEIGGHTDDQGANDYNQQLSSLRAEAVYKHLCEAGIDTNRISHKGYGELMPIDSNETEEGRARNRRTEFKIVVF